MTDFAGFVGQFSAGDASPLEQARAAELRQDAKEAAEERRREEEREAAREARAEGMAFAEARFGHPLAQMSAARARFTEYDDKCRDLADQLHRAEAKRDQAQANVEFFAQRAAEARDMVTRSVPADPVAATLQRAREAHREFTRATRAALSEAATGQRPKGRGYVVRGEPPDCEACKAVGADAWESWQIHHMTADGRPVAEDPDRPVPAPVPDGHAREVERLTEFGFSREAAELAQQPVISR
jgi:hypothetical protein